MACQPTWVRFTEYLDIFCVVFLRVFFFFCFVLMRCQNPLRLFSNNYLYDIDYVYIHNFWHNSIFLKDKMSPSVDIFKLVHHII